MSEAFQPAVLTAVTVDPDDPLQFEFYVDPGQGSMPNGRHDEYLLLVKDFMASLAVPEEQLWVNLSPYEKDRIIDERFGLTDMGRDLLAQDYILKQITASLIYPEEDIGRDFWAEVYSKAQEQFGTIDIPVDNFNKVWIMPDVAEVYQQGASAMVLKAHLKVMLEADYLAMENNVAGGRGTSTEHGPLQELTKQVLREVIVPVLEKEVNTGRHFARLRQIYNALILAAWYKKTMRESFLGRAYVDQGKVEGIQQLDPGENRRIYGQYLEALQKGVFDYIKEEVDGYSGEVIPRKYFSGGVFVPKDFSENKLVVRTTLDAAERKSVDFSEKKQKVKVLVRENKFAEDKNFDQRIDSMKGIVDEIKDLNEGLEANADKLRSGVYRDERKRQEIINSIQDKVNRIRDNEKMLEDVASLALRAFLDRENRSNVSRSPEAIKARDLVVEKLFADILASKKEASLRRLMLDGAHTEAAFRHFLVVAELSGDRRDISYHDVVRLLGVHPDLEDFFTEKIRSFGSESDFEALYTKIFKQVMALGPSKTLFAQTWEDEDLAVIVKERLLSYRDKDGRDFWNTEFSGSRERNNKLDEALLEAEAVMPSVYAFVDKWVPVAEDMKFFRVKDTESAKGKVHARFPVLAEIQDLLGFMTIYLNMAELEKATRKVVRNSIQFRNWERAIKREIEGLRGELKVGNNHLKPPVRKSKESRLAALEMELVKKINDVPIRIEFDNKFISNLHKRYYAALHGCFVIENELKGRNHWTVEGQFKTLGQAIAQYLDHKYIYKADHEEKAIQEAVKIDNWLVLAVEVANYLYSKSKEAQDLVKEALVDKAEAKKAMARVEVPRPTGGIDIRDVEGALDIEGREALSWAEKGDIQDKAGRIFSPVILSMVTVDGLPFLRSQSPPAGVFSRN